MPIRVNAQARGELNFSTVRSDRWKTFSVSATCPSGLLIVTAIPSAHSERPWESSEPISSFHVRS